MPSADDPQQTTWQWADVDGSRHSASQAELTQLLESGALPAFTLVWNAGWSEWLEARECELFAACIPAAQRKPTRVAETDDEHSEVPPDPPLERYASQQKQSALRALLGTGAAP
ncbi:MAG: GYF domain-containing protein, partial [Polyangiaceae bacterium]